MQRKKHLQLKIISSVLTLSVLMNLAARFVHGFADFYTEKIFRKISVPLSALNSLIPFSVGELLIIIGIIVLVIGVPVFIVLMLRCKTKRKKIARFAALFLGWVLAYVSVTETLNCFVQYQCTSFAEKYYPEHSQDKFTVSQLSEMCEYFITQANELAEKVPRDENGVISLPDDLEKKAAEYMQALDSDYSGFSGYYPNPKKIINSETMSRLDLQGIYFPFTMESNYNGDMFTSRVPCTVCHEFSHLKGFISEDEAGFIAYLACSRSDDPLFMYSGTLSALNYTMNRLFRYIDYDEKVRLSAMISDKVRGDNKFVSDEYREKINKNKLISGEKAAEVSKKALNTNLKVNGVSDGVQSYGRMVDLLLIYYYNYM